MKKIPVTIPLNHDGSFNDILQDFINTMKTVTGGDVDVECSLDGTLTIYFESDSSVNKNKRPEMFIDMDVLYRGDYLKSLYTSEPESNKLQEDGKTPR
jgi:hypothetical protein